jgi:hypothetical protein
VGLIEKYFRPIGQALLNQLTNLSEVAARLIEGILLELLPAEGKVPRNLLKKAVKKKKARVMINTEQYKQRKVV